MVLNVNCELWRLDIECGAGQVSVLCSVAPLVYILLHCYHSKEDDEEEDDEEDDDEEEEKEHKNAYVRRTCHVTLE